MLHFNKQSIQFLEEYDYQVLDTDDVITIKNGKHSSPVLNIVLIIFGLAGIPLLFAGQYKIGLLLLLMVTIPIIRIANNAPKHVIIDLKKKMINKVAFSLIDKFDFATSEAFAYATAFEQGTTDYTLTLEAITKFGKHIPLMSFVDRHEEKSGSESFLKEMNSLLTE